MTTPVIFGGRYYSFRMALLLMVGLYIAKGINNGDNMEAISTATGSVIFISWFKFQPSAFQALGISWLP